jgi:HEPN domain-containing protein
MKTNISLAEKWIVSTIADIKRLLRALEVEDFADVAFRSQFAVEKLNKSILVLLGVKIQKTHEPTKILKDVLKDKEYRKFNEESEELIKEIITYSLIFEEEGTKTRYGFYKEDEFLVAEEIYTSIEDIKIFIINLEKIITIYINIIQDVFQIPETELKDLMILKNIKEQNIWKAYLKVKKKY